MQGKGYAMKITKKFTFDIDTVLETLTNVLFFLGLMVIILFTLWLGFGLIIHGANYIPPDKDTIIRIGGIAATLLLLSVICFIIYSLRD